MTDRDLGEMLAHARDVERQARAYAASTPDVAERDAASVVLRHAAVLRQSFEAWIGTRAIRAALKQ